MRIGIVQFPGSNCERETAMAIRRADMEPVEFLWNEPTEKLAELDGYIIIGGFSYEDRSRAGVIAALDPVMQAIKAESEKGKPVLGICNGAQILVESGLVPGIEDNKVGMALTENKRMQNNKVLGTGYYNAWVNMRLADGHQHNAFTKFLTTKDILTIPIAHAEGRFVMGEGLLHEMQQQGQVLFQYCDEAGAIDEHFPVNPNGSVANIAAVSNKAGNVMAMMPHPERTPVGDPILQSMRDYIKASSFQSVAPLNYYPRKEQQKDYQLQKGSFQCLVELMITDNHALTVENTLRSLGFDVSIKRYAHWEVACDDMATYANVMASGVLLNNRKERLVEVSGAKPAVLVRAKEDWVGLQKQQQLQDHFGVTGLQHIKHGIVWEIQSETTLPDDALQRVMNTHIFANPYAHDISYFRTR